MRGIDFLGTSALDTNESAMREWTDLAQNYEGAGQPLLDRLPTGQAQRSDWIIKDIKDQQGEGDEPSNTDFIYKFKGNFGPSGYDDMSKFKIRQDRLDSKRPHIDSNNIKLTYHEEAQEDWPTFQRIREELQREDNLKMLIGLPSHVELPMFMLASDRNPLPGFMNVEPFRRAYQMQVDKIWNDPAIGTHADKNKDIAWQIEMPVITAVIAKAMRATRGAVDVSDRFAKRIIGPQVQGLPEGAGVVAHPCFGDYYGRYYTKRLLEAVVDQTESIVGYWPSGRTLDAVHFPFGAGQVAPSVNSKDYKAIGRLAKILDPGTDLIAGIVHYDKAYTPQKHFDVRNMIEDQLGREVRISYYCGYGRTKPEIARLMTQRCIDLALHDQPTELSTKLLSTNR